MKLLKSNEISRDLIILEKFKQLRDLYLAMGLCLALVACDNQDVVNSSVDTTFKGLFNIDSISPVSASPGSEVTIKGEGFNEKTAVTFANVNAEIKSQSESEIVFVVPEGMETASFRSAAHWPYLLNHK